MCDVTHRARRAQCQGLHEHAEHGPSDHTGGGAQGDGLLLPLDAQTRTANEVWVAFLSRSLVDAGARQLSAEGDRYLADLFRTTLRHLAEAGHLAPAADVDLEADRLRALFDGLCLQSVTAPDRMPPDRVRAIYEQHLSTLIHPTAQGNAPRGC
ncbi:TetR family transcriptional regulator C-terminal domain-containing protein [Actinomadura geliboluensis]|uniref:TetR family transcriptional regulator C-terminal domain-containing protein n=1 Tax=Actinomadura geliboluensis TaxID=882440 RepID=UPI00371FBC5B